jgi:cytochrome c oxidase assembly factor CtaG/ferredoxin
VLFEWCPGCFAAKYFVVTVAEAALASWSARPGVMALLFVAAVLYWRGWLRLSRLIPHRFPPWRLVSFLSGLAGLVIAVCSPLDAFAGLLLSVHMVQHLLLTMIVPPLLLLGAPYLPILTGLPRRFVVIGLGPFLHARALKSLGRFVIHPVTAWIAFIASNVVWHIPAAYEIALRDPFWHQIEHASFLTTALLFWWPVVQPWPSRPVWPRWAMIPYLLLADLQNTALAAFLSFYEQVLYPTYAQAPRLSALSALDDQAAAGAIMWVPGSLAFLIPAGLIAFQFLSPRHAVRPSSLRRPTITSHQSQVTSHSSSRNCGIPAPPRPRFSLLLARFRRVIQAALLLLAGIVVLDGLLGPKLSPMNLAGVLPWTHWRGFTVVALLAAGNLFCFACPFTFVRDMARRVVSPRYRWPKAFRSKWLAVFLIAAYLWAYEAFGLWDSPWLTAWIIIGYFLAALVVDLLFKGASFCKYVCPIGQFHFVQSLASPLEVKVRAADLCASCETHDCLRGNDDQRGCELHLFQPRKSGNMDCTFCLDCVKACPHENVGLIPVIPASDIWTDDRHSSIGRYAKRPDLAALVAILTFGAFANAAGMIAPTFALEAALGMPRVAFTSLFLFLLIFLVPLLLLSLSTFLSHTFGRLAASLKETACAFTTALAPLGFGMWLAHFTFHLFTGSHTPIPVVKRIVQDLGIDAFGPPNWQIASFAFPGLLNLELLLLDAGFLVALYAQWRIAKRLAPSRPVAALLPWAVLTSLLFLAGLWIVFQPMEMRGTLLH